MTDPTTELVEVTRDDDRAQMLQDFMEQYHGRCLRASEWDAIVAFLDQHPSPAAKRLSTRSLAPEQVEGVYEQAWNELRRYIYDRTPERREKIIARFQDRLTALGVSPRG